MSANEVAALIVAITTAAGAIFAGIRNLRSDTFKHDVEQSAALLGGYSSMVDKLQGQVDRLENERRADSVAWQEERVSIRKEHADEILRSRQEHLDEVRELNERIDELGAQVYALQNRPQGTRGRSTDHG